eukprot:TRINITY_DN616_c0_g1_i2.p1 TRINITY_DN616_c0_g1~~TRINITY_DN616_c0_g1_i2.p1  ORF type:complete len:215 (-),score=28.32 TRINITY_DN616_c0_g1_i2:89-733(-)
MNLIFSRLWKTLTGNGSFPNSIFLTVHRKQVTVDDEVCILDIFDTAGQEVIINFFCHSQNILWMVKPIIDHRITNSNKLTCVHVHQVFSAVRDQYMRSGDGFLIVYSITVQESFDQAIELHQHILQVKDTDEVSVVLVGNKCDMSDSREVPVEKGKDLAAELNCPFFETSAKTNVNVKEIFESLVKEINNRRKDNNNTAGDKKTDRKRRKCILL